MHVSLHKSNLTWGKAKLQEKELICTKRERKGF